MIFIKNLRGLSGGVSPTSEKIGNRMGWFAAFLGTGEGSKRRCEVRRVARDFNRTELRRRVHDLRESLSPHSNAPRCFRRRSVLRLPRPLPNVSLLLTKRSEVAATPQR